MNGAECHQARHRPPSLSREPESQELALNVHGCPDWSSSGLLTEKPDQG